MSIRPKAGAVLFAKDSNRMAKFYEGVATMTIVHSECGVTVLESDDIRARDGCDPEGNVLQLRETAP